MTNNKVNQQITTISDKYQQQHILSLRHHPIYVGLWTSMVLIPISSNGNHLIYMSKEQNNLKRNIALEPKPSLGSRKILKSDVKHTQIGEYIIYLFVCDCCIATFKTTIYSCFKFTSEQQLHSLPLLSIIQPATLFLVGDILASGIKICISRS